MTLLPRNTGNEHTHFSMSISKQFGEGNEDTKHDINNKLEKNA